MSTNTIAATILEQLGGNRFVAMTGANHLVAESQALTFRLARGGKDRINFVRIELKPLDEYRIDFMRWHRIDFFTIAIREHVQAEDLREVFESVTELRTSLGSMGVRHV